MSTLHSLEGVQSADAFIPCRETFLEIKSAKVKSGTKIQFQIKRIRHLIT